MAIAGESTEIQGTVIVTTRADVRRNGVLTTVRDALGGTDLRSLAVFRIAIALIVLADLIARMGTLTIHYTDDGVLPRSVAGQSLTAGRWSLLLLNGETWFAGLVFGAAALAAIAMLIGYHTRLATFAVWVLIISIQIRNPLLLSAADNLLRQLLFWSILLPIGARWSFDARSGNPGDRRGLDGFASLATVGLFLQIVFMYWFTAILKDSTDWRSDGSALGYALNAGQLTTDFGAWAGGYPDVLALLTWCSIGLEIIAPILLFIPFRNPQLRLVAITAIVLFQLGIGLTMDIGIFPWTSALCMLCFLPSWFWDDVVPWIRRIPRPTVAPQEDAPQASPKSAFAIWIHSLASTLAIVSLVIVFAWNVMTVSDFVFPMQARPLAYSLGLPQQWNMFAPRPPHSTQWFVVSGSLKGGEQVNLIPAITSGDFDRMVPLTYERPDHIAADWYGSKYWRKYFSAVGDNGADAQRNAMFRYVCQHWNTDHGDGELLRAVTMVSVSEPTRFDDVTVDARRAVIAIYDCAG